MRLLDAFRLAPLLEKELLDRSVKKEAVKHVVDNLIQTSLRGVDSHGINLFPHYLRALEANRINGSSEALVIKETAGSGVIDGDHGFGHFSGARAIDLAIEKSETTGVAAVSVINSTHFAAAAYYSLLAADRDKIGLAFTNADALLKSPNSAETFLGTNPICFAAPLQEESPFCLDMATSVVSFNKIKNHRVEDSEIPQDWAYTKEGESTTNPHLAETLAPIADYKGYGLSMMVDILCSVLTGSRIGKDIVPMYTAPIEAKRHLSHFFLVIDIGKFIEIETFKNTLQNFVNRARSQTPINKSFPVMVAGDPEKKMLEIRKENGIPITESIFEEYLRFNPHFINAVKA